MQDINLTNQFLIAMPNLHDAGFSRTVTYICEHSKDGAMGLILNRSTGLHLGDILSQMNIIEQDPAIGEHLVYNGGPVQPDRGFILHTSEKSWDSSLHVTDHICVTSSRDVLEAMASNQGPKKTFVALGYAGWGSGQLEMEISANSWLSCPATDSIIFDLPEDKRWHAAADLLGINLTLMSVQAGHA